jgi:hypothetical protein
MDVFKFMAYETHTFHSMRERDIETPARKRVNPHELGSETLSDGPCSVVVRQSHPAMAQVDEGWLKYAS